MARHFVAASSDYIDCGTGVRGSDVHSITVAAWINLDSHTAERKIVARWNATADRSWLLHVNSNGTVSFDILSEGGTGYGATSTTVLSNGVWYHVAGTTNGSNVVVYVNGSAEQTVGIGSQMKASTVAMLIGKDGAGQPFDGSIAEVTVYLGAWPSIIRPLSEGASPVDLEGMVTQDHIGYWPLLGTDPEHDVTATDHGLGPGSPNNGTLHGTTATTHPGVRSLSAFKV